MASCVAVRIRNEKEQVKPIPDLPTYDEISTKWTPANANNQLDEVTRNSHHYFTCPMIDLL